MLLKRMDRHGTRGITAALPPPILPRFNVHMTRNGQRKSERRKASYIELCPYRFMRNCDSDSCIILEDI